MPRRTREVQLLIESNNHPVSDHLKKEFWRMKEELSESLRHLFDGLNRGWIVLCEKLDGFLVGYKSRRFSQLYLRRFDLVATRQRLLSHLRDVIGVKLKEVTASDGLQGAFGLHKTAFEEFGPLPLLFCPWETHALHAVPEQE